MLQPGSAPAGRQRGAGERGRGTGGGYCDVLHRWVEWYCRGTAVGPGAGAAGRPDAGAAPDPWAACAPSLHEPWPSFCRRPARALARFIIPRLLCLPSLAAPPCPTPLHHPLPLLIPPRPGYHYSLPFLEGTGIVSIEVKEGWVGRRCQSSGCFSSMGEGAGHSALEDGYAASSRPGSKVGGPEAGSWTMAA